MSKQLGMPLLVVLVFLLATLACGGEAEAPPAAVEEASVDTPQTEAQMPQPASTPEPAPTPIPTDTPVPTDTPEPTVPPKTEPDILLEINGTGATVTDNYQLLVCQKAVFYWTAASNPSNAASLIIHLHKAGEDSDIYLVNEFDMDVAEGIGGSVLQPLSGGEYYFSTENTDEAWTMRVECQDGMAPVAAGLELEGGNNAVSANYELPACQKSIFNWSVEPNQSGSASLIVHLYKVGEDQYVGLVNEFKMDQSGPLDGKALQKLSGGVYYITTENLSGPWKIRWECQD